MQHQDKEFRETQAELHLGKNMVKETRRKFSFDPTVSLGHVITLASILVSITIAWATFKTEIVLMQRDINDHRKAITDNILLLNKLADNQSSLTRAVDKLVYITEQHDNRLKAIPQRP